MILSKTVNLIKDFFHHEEFTPVLNTSTMSGQPQPQTVEKVEEMDWDAIDDMLINSPCFQSFIPNRES